MRMSTESNLLVKKNLEWLITKAKTSPYALEKMTGVKQPTIHRILTGESVDPRTNTLQPLADYFGVSVSDLRDRDLSDSDWKEAISMEKGAPRILEIPQYHEIGGSMGSGLILRDQPGEIQGWRVTPEWVTKNVKSHTGASNLRIVTGFGDSMRPLFNPGDPLLVDAGVKTVDFDSIYFFRIGDEGFIKRLQRVPGQGLVAISENKSYRDWIITPNMDFQVFARVIKVWCGSDF